MTEHAQPTCCGRTMTSIGVEQGASALRLHSCPACGRHAWRSDGVEVDRPALLEALRVSKPASRKRTRPPAAPAPAPAPAAAAPAASAEDARRSELQRLLSGFTVHGSTS